MHHNVLYRRSLDDDSFYPFILPTAAPKSFKILRVFLISSFTSAAAVPPQKKIFHWFDPSRKTSVAFVSLRHIRTTHTHTLNSSPFVLQSFFLFFFFLSVYMLFILFFFWLVCLLCTCLKAAWITLLNHSLRMVRTAATAAAALADFLAYIFFIQKKVVLCFCQAHLHPSSLRWHLLLSLFLSSPSNPPSPPYYRYKSLYIRSLFTFYQSFFGLKTIFFNSFFFCSIHRKINRFFSLPPCTYIMSKCLFFFFFF